MCEDKDVLYFLLMIFFVGIVYVLKIFADVRKP